MASKSSLVVANNNGRTHVGKYELGRTLGEGNFAKVKFARNIDTGENVAIKILDKEKILKHKMITQMHTKGSCHRAAESKLNETELRRQDKMNKQVALSDSSTGTANCNAYHQKFRSVGKPLIEQTRNLASEILNNKTPQQNSSNANHDLQLILDRLTDGNSNLNQNSPCPIEVTDKVVVQPHLDFQERRERELKFTAAGWKHDCQGKWFRDENVEFDSDEDDPNVCLG